MITYVFLGITAVWLFVSLIVGAFQTLMGQTVTAAVITTPAGSAPDNVGQVIGWLLNSVAFFFKMFAFQVSGAEIFSVVWLFMAIAWVYCLIRIIHTGGT